MVKWDHEADRRAFQTTTPPSSPLTRSPLRCSQKRRTPHRQVTPNSPPKFQRTATALKIPSPAPPVRAPPPQWGGASPRGTTARPVPRVLFLVPSFPSPSQPSKAFPMPASGPWMSLTTFCLKTFRMPWARGIRWEASWTKWKVLWKLFTLTMNDSTIEYIV